MSNVFPGRLIESVNGQVGVITVVEDKHHVYEQLSATNNWTINHGLGKHASWTLTDLDGNTVMPENAIYVNDNQITFTFSKPFAGRVYFN